MTCPLIICIQYSAQHKRSVLYLLANKRCCNYPSRHDHVKFHSLRGRCLLNLIQTPPINQSDWSECYNHGTSRTRMGLYVIGNDIHTKKQCSHSNYLYAVNVATLHPKYQVTDERWIEYLRVHSGVVVQITTIAKKSV